jgi:hypothetical protein
MKIAYGILGLGLALLSLAAFGLASGPIAMGGLLAFILGGFAVVIVLEEHDLADETVVQEAMVEAQQPSSSLAA